MDTGLVADDSSEDDRSLVEAALRQRNAYGHIVNRFESVLGRYVRRLLGRHGQSAEDVLQDVFIKAYVNLNDFDRSRPLAPWLYRIAHNEAVSFLRKRGAQPQTIDGDDGLLILERMSASNTPNETGGSARIEKMIRTGLEGLGGKYREVLVLRYLEEKTYDEIADILELPMGTVATRIKRGLERLKASLQAMGADIEWHDAHE